jgi:hypothetical protein
MDSGTTTTMMMMCLRYEPMNQRDGYKILGSKSNLMLLYRKVVIFSFGGSRPMFAQSRGGGKSFFVLYCSNGQKIVVAFVVALP